MSIKTVIQVTHNSVSQVSSLLYYRPLTSLMVKKFPRLLLIFSLSTLTKPLWSQYRTNSRSSAPLAADWDGDDDEAAGSYVCWCEVDPHPQQDPAAARLWANSFSWWGKTRSRPPANVGQMVIKRKVNGVLGQFQPAESGSTIKPLRGDIILPLHDAYYILIKNAML